MVSTSDRKSGSSGPSKARKSVYVSTAPRGRTGSKDGGGGTRADGRARVPSPAPSDSHVRAQERKQQRDARISAQRRTRGLRAAAVVAAVIAVLAGCVGIYGSSLFAIDTVEVVGNSHATVDAIRALARVPADATLIRFPADAVVDRVSKDPWVDSVSVSRVFPSGMRIRVVERVPIAVVDAGAAMWLIDRNGAVIATASVDTSGVVPTISDVPGLDLKPGRRTTSEPLLNALRVLAGLSKQLAGSVRTVSAPTIDGTALVTIDRVEVVVGEAVDLAKKDALAQRILNEQHGKVVSIDVRIVDRPTWRGLK